MSHTSRPPHMSAQPYRASHMSCCCRVLAGAHVRRCQLRGVIRKAAAVCARLLLRAVRRRCSFDLPFSICFSRGSGHACTTGTAVLLVDRACVCAWTSPECTRAARTPQYICIYVHCGKYVICMPLRNPAVAVEELGFRPKDRATALSIGKLSSHNP